MSKTATPPSDPNLDAKLDQAFGDASSFKAAMSAAAGATPLPAIVALSGPTLRETRTLAEALAIVQASIPEVVKAEEGKVEKDGKFLYKYSYADLAAVTRAILPRLGAVGLSWVTMPTIVDGKFVLVYKLLHASGEALEGVYPLPAGATPQATGSAITYARRYCLCSVTGVAPSDDDDAAEAQAAATQQSSRPTPRQGMSNFERETGLVLLYPPSAEQRANAGQIIMDQSFRQALDFAICLDEHSAWDIAPGQASDTWAEIFRARVTDEIAAADTGEQINTIWQALKASKLLNDAFNVQLKERAAAIKERNAKAYDTLVQQVTSATLEDLQEEGPVHISVIRAHEQGRITKQQYDELLPLVGERIKRLEREQNQGDKA